ncbi:relaxase/mobilization nuclease domain-containing protein [Neisseria sp. Ec49-e6-T10]|uniref:relaxase/mobilization nuclease domain-containing protein n=1 Tax=Neisseria sp. Ec49-e6-T10 TaxID=3140744 RepID=UPI003EBCEF39
MSDLNKRVDDWFLGYKTRSVKSKSGADISPRNHSKVKPLKSGSGIANLKAAALKHPEVMVKVPTRKSANSKGMKGIRSHVDYISRNGQLELEDRDGNIIKGKSEINQHLADWKKLNIPEKSKHREALNVVLSMPAGTDPVAVKNAARAFAQEQFEHHEYLFTQHLDQQHPHVHICVLMRDEFGKRMNPRKNDLFEWRVRFAEKLRDEGVQCAATRRQHRGRTQKPEESRLRRMRLRGSPANIHKIEALALVEALKNNDRPKHPFIKETMQTRDIIVENYGLIARELYKMGNKEEARIISKLAKEVSQANFTTQPQQRFDEIKNKTIDLNKSENMERS